MASCELTHSKDRKENEELNYCRMYMLTHRVSREVLVAFLDKKVKEKTKDLNAYLDEEKHTLFHRSRYNKCCICKKPIRKDIEDNQWKAMYEKTEKMCLKLGDCICKFGAKADINSFDVCLLCKLLLIPGSLNINNLEKDQIRFIQFYRNKTSHPQQTSVTGVRFISEWGDLEASIMELARNCSDALHSRMGVEISRMKTEFFTKDQVLDIVNSCNGLAYLGEYIHPIHSPKEKISAQTDTEHLRQRLNIPELLNHTVTEMEPFPVMDSLLRKAMITRSFYKQLCDLPMREQRSRDLLDSCIAQSDDRILTSFLDALQETKQMCLLNDITEGNNIPQSRFFTDWQDIDIETAEKMRQRLESTHSYMMKEMEPLPVMDYFLIHRIVTCFEYEDVHKMSSREERCRYILDIVKSDSALGPFVYALEETEQTDLLKFITEGNDILRPHYFIDWRIMDIDQTDSGLVIKLGTSKRPDLESKGLLILSRLDERSKEFVPGLNTVSVTKGSIIILLNAESPGAVSNFYQTFLKGGINVLLEGILEKAGILDQVVNEQITVEVIITSNKESSEGYQDTYSIEDMFYDKCRSYLCEELSPGPIVAFLVDKGILDIDEVNEIFDTRNHRRADKTACLLKLMKQKDPNLLKDFQECLLLTHHDYVLRKINIQFQAQFDRRLALLGNSGAGKSTTGNLLLGKQNCFQTSMLPDSKASLCKDAHVTHRGKNYKIVDTRFLDTRLVFKDVQEIIIPFISKTSPGPHATLYVMKAGGFTQEEQDSVEMYTNMFGAEILNHTIVVFTKLSEDNRERDYMSNLHTDMKDFLQKCGNRYVFLPSPKSPKMNAKINQLFDMIDSMIMENEGTFYTDQMYEAQQKVLEEKLQEQRQEMIRKEEERREKKQSKYGDRRNIITTEQRNTRLAVLGRTGAGKSTTRHLLLGKPSLVKTFDETGVTHKGKNYKIVDTPGFLDTRLGFKDLQERIIPFISKTSPGPHATLYVMEAGRFTAEEQDSVEMYTNMFGAEILNHTIVVFTKLSEDNRERDYMANLHTDVKDFLQKCGNRYVFLPSPKSPKMNAKISQLFDMIASMIMENEGTFYTDQMYEAQQKVLEEKLQEQRQEMIRKEEERREKKESKYGDRENITKFEQRNTRLAVLGRTGAGKSTTRHLLLGKPNLVKTFDETGVETSKCENVDVTHRGKNYKIVDTPGFLDTRLVFKDVQERIIPFISKTSPGTHATLYVMEAGRLTAEEQESIEMYTNMFGADILNHTIVVFTKLGEDTRERDYMSNLHIDMKDFLQKCGNRHIFLPSLKSPEMKTKINQLFEMIDSMVSQNKGSYYTDAMFKAQQEVLEEKLEEQRQKMIREEEEVINKIKEECNKEFKHKIDLLEKDVNISKLEREKKEQELDQIRDKMNSCDSTIKNLEHQITLANQKVADLSRRNRRRKKKILGLFR